MRGFARFEAGAWSLVVIALALLPMRAAAEPAFVWRAPAVCPTAD